MDAPLEGESAVAHDTAGEGLALHRSMSAGGRAVLKMAFSECQVQEPQRYARHSL